MTSHLSPSPHKRIYIQEVVTRDGFQAESAFIPTEEKIALIDRLSNAGYAKIEVSSFTSPKAIPMLADAEAVMQGINRIPGVEYTVLIPNLKGAERAIAVGVDEFNLVMSVSETHNQANLKMGREDSFKGLSSVIDLAHSNKIAVNISLSTSFGCPMSGITPLKELMHWIDRFSEKAFVALRFAIPLAWLTQPKFRKSVKRSKLSTPTYSGPCTSTTPVAWVWPTLLQLLIAV